MLLVLHYTARQRLSYETFGFGFCPLTRKYYRMGDSVSLKGKGKGKDLTRRERD